MWNSVASRRGPAPGRYAWIRRRSVRQRRYYSKIRYIGVSNFSGWHLMKSLSVADRYGYPRYIANQTYYSLIGRDYEWELMPLGLDQGVGAVVWSPLGWGRLTGKFRRGQRICRRPVGCTRPPKWDRRTGDDYVFKVVDALDAIAAETGKTVPQVALNWLLRRPTVASVIIGARNEQQLRQNLGAVGLGADIGAGALSRRGHTRPARRPQPSALRFLRRKNHVPRESRRSARRFPAAARAAPPWPWRNAAPGLAG